MGNESERAQGVGAYYFGSAPIPGPYEPYEQLIQKAETKTSLEKKEDGGSDWIEPYYPLDGLKAVVAQSTILPQCITAYGSNIAGCGLEPEYIDDVGGEDESSEMEAEWDEAQRVIDLLNPDGKASDVFVEAVKERERCGIAFIECIRDGSGNVVEIHNILETETVRMSRRQPEAHEYTVNYRGKEITRRKAFKFYRQMVNGKTVYFKEFGDERQMDNRTGEYVETPLPIEYQANELLVLKIGESHYGAVRWEGQIVTADGSYAAERLNGNYFHNGRHTPILILVNNGRLTDQARTEIQSYLSGVKGEKSQFGFLLVETETQEKDVAFENDAKPTVEIKDLSPMLQKDALFSEYLEANRRKIQSAFRLPDVYLAYTTDYNRATVYAAMSLTEEQVFRPERERLEWIINNQLLNSYGWKHVRIKVNEPDLVDQDAVSSLMSVVATNGGLTPNIAKEKIYDLLGLENCEPYEGSWADYPLETLKLLPQEQLAEMFGMSVTEAAAEPSAEIPPTVNQTTEEPEEENTSGLEEAGEELDEAIGKAERDNATEQTLFVLRETRNLLRQLTKERKEAE